MSCGGGAPDAPPPCQSTEVVDITNLIMKTGCFALNEDPRHPWANLFMGDDRLQFRSDTDEQLILHLALSECVKLHSISLKAPDPEAAPDVVKLFINRPSFSFGDAESTEPTQTLDLRPDNLAKGERIILKFVKFQRVNSLTVFVESNNGKDYSALSSLRIFGTPLQGTDLSKIKKSG